MKLNVLTYQLGTNNEMGHVRLYRVVQYPISAKKLPTCMVLSLIYLLTVHKLSK